VKISKEVRIGVIVTLAIALLIFGFNFLKGKNVFFEQVKYYAVYDRVEGLVESNPVQINGYSVGHVDKISFLPDNSGRIVVRFVIKEEEFQIPRNTVARVVSSDLLGSKAVQLILGKSQQFHEPGDTLISGIQASLTEEVNKQVAPIKVKAEKLISSLDSVLAVIQYIFNEESTENIKESFESINTAIRTLKKTALRVDTLVIEQRTRLARISSNVEAITSNFRSNNEKLNKIITNFASISDSMAKANFAATIANANRALTQTASITEKINRGEGSLGLLVNNDSLYNNLNAASRDLDLLLEDVRLHPKRYVSISVFGRKDKPIKEKSPSSNSK